jgi:EAL domain-containing protein (putative c-di-GMP-specific phosphodiesterase class I)
MQDLRALAELRPDFVKVARELAAGVHRHAGRRTVVQGLVSLTSALGATLVVEGVETGEELEVLREMGVDCVQGYLLGRPAATMGATLPVPLALQA